MTGVPSAMGLLRRGIERLSRGRALKRRLPAEFQGCPLYVSPDSALRFLRPGSMAFDGMLLRLALRLVEPGSIVWDIGANVGVFAFASAARAPRGMVVAVEPDAFLVSLLRRSRALEENADLNLEIVPAAISDSDGVTTLSIAGRGRAANTISGAFVGSQQGGVRETLTVPTLQLDTLLRHFQAPNLVKIDVEGAEALVLRGATRVLEQIRPTIVIEVGHAEEAAVRKIFSDFRYVLYDAESTEPRPGPIERCAWNTLAFPREAVA